ncbi:hypothetical protein GCG54_00011586 [Colletotrichum gloeosporioides]|uniref:Uncharacterized protein n=1 Tax=Colletotrichum gloeosporioides TaxID=474922 RepID=A0A8H4FP72_COLGL|nr:uncharacterized protein GCG54_00011586 [Colletotrichum gloeosporioides]KAF3809387.1 hypothetical protein GCG54_00011586 [Colletotrichum gloeosporioides]
MSSASGNQHATYHLAPDFSISPPPDGTLDLGSIIDDLIDPDPLNQNPPIAPAKVFKDEKKGFQASRSSMKRGEFGIWAKVVGIEGLGGEAAGSLETTSETTYRFKSIETTYFSANEEYICQALKEEAVQQYLNSSKSKIVYTVTGLNIARGPAASVSSSKRGEVHGEGSFSQPELGVSKENTASMEFEVSSDFVTGIRVKRLRYKRSGRMFGARKLSISKYHSGATLVGIGEETKEKTFHVEEMDEDMEGMHRLVDDVEIDPLSEVAIPTTFWLLSQTRIPGGEL